MTTHQQQRGKSSGRLPALVPGDYNAGHATSAPLPEPLALPDPGIFEDPECATTRPDVSPAEAAYFKRNGFLVKRGLANDQAALAAAVDHVWHNVPRGLLQRDDPATWLAAPHQHWTPADAERVGLLTHGNWKMRSRGTSGIGTEAFLVDGIANHPAVLAVAERLIGGPVQPARRVRGIYSILPKPVHAPVRYGPHADYMAAHLSAMVLVDDVPPHCGGFLLWPGSHRALHPHWDTVHGGIISATRADGFRRARDTLLRHVTPVEFSGRAGDVIFWHPRALHAAGVNHSAASDRPRVRILVPCDYQRAGRTWFDDEQFGPGASFQWWIDTRNFREDVAPTADNLWEDWGI